MDRTKEGEVVKCRRIARMIPLAAGGDLSSKKRKDFHAHLRGCDACRKEYEEFSNILNSARDWLAEEPVEWLENEWRQSVRSVAEEARPGAFPLAPWPFRRSWAYAFMGAATVLLLLFFTRPPFIARQLGLRDLALSGAAAAVQEQDVIQMTLVSHESGLQIQWFFNKDFEWKENNK